MRALTMRALTMRACPHRFGEGTQDEMCFAFIVYYPKMDEFDWCITNADNATAACGAAGKVAAAVRGIGNVTATTGPNVTATGSNNGGPVTHGSASGHPGSRSEGGVDPQVRMLEGALARMAVAGVLYPSTMPTGYSPYEDPACKSL